MRSIVLPPSYSNVRRTGKKTAPAGNRGLILTADKERVMTDSQFTQFLLHSAICVAGDGQ